jgi:hypothetical protein
LRSFLLFLGLLAALQLLGSCNDNVGCVFTGGCDDPDGALSSNAALQPVDGEWLATVAPEVEAFFPSGTGHAGTTPMVLVFSETMQLVSLMGAFEVVREGSTQPIRVAEALVSDGRVLVLLPASMDPLDPGTYVVQLAEEAEPVDLTGQELGLDPGEEVGRFTVVASPIDEPRLVTTFPEDDAEDQGESLELVVVFDRPIDAATVTPSSFDVRVNGAQPVPDPPAAPLRVGTLQDTRVFLYQRLDPDGLPLPFGRDAEVEIRFSPAGNKITDDDEDDPSELDALTVSFQTLAFAPPLEASLLSDPFDAIGLANLTVGDPEELMVEVELDMAQPNDVLDLYLFGTERSDEADPPLIAVLASKRLTGLGDIQSATFTRAEVPIQRSNAPSDVRFRDGSLTFAFVLRRGQVSTPVRVLDIDDDPETILDPELDITAPILGAWIGSDDTDTFRSDLRDLGLAGVADERVRGVEVSTQFGTNGPLAPVVGADDSGLFLAAPVALGRLDGGTTTFSAVLRDRAQNPTGAVDGDYRQLGGLGPQPYAPGLDIEVEVFAADTLAPLAGASVLVHSDLGTGQDFPFFGAGVTGPDGRAVVATAPGPSVAAIVTVVLAGRDLFTLHGVPVTRLSVPLASSGVQEAAALGRVVTTDSGALAIAGLDRLFDDSRQALELPLAFQGGGCGIEQEVFGCDYGEAPQRADRLGARSFFAGDFSSAPDSTEFLQAFALLLPLDPADAGDPQEAELDLEGLLPTDVADPESARVTPPFQVRLPPASGLVPPLADESEFPGPLRAGLETLVPGLGGSIAVGPALSIPTGADLWTVRGAYPGAITAAGSLGGMGSVETDPFVRVEVVDTQGNASGVRVRLSSLDAAGTTERITLAVPVLLEPLQGASTGGQAFDLSLGHAIGDERTEGGVYRVVLEDAAGRRWILWRFDGAGAADVQLRAVDVGDAGVVGLADGDLTATTAAFAWQGFSPTDFLWSDIEREFELHARSLAVVFQKP